MTTFHAVTDEEVAQLKGLPTFAEIFIEVFRWFDIDLADDAIGEGEVDPTECAISEERWEEIADIIIQKHGQGAGLKWMSAGPSGQAS